MSRQKSAKKRILKISKIAKLNRKARKLFTGSGFTTSTWGHQGSGISESRMKNLESDALACSGIKPAGRCRTMALAITYGILGTPRSRVVRETMRAWFDVVRASNEQDIADIRAAWPKARDTLINKNKNANHIHGLMSNVIYILLHARWDPRTFNLWVDKKGDNWIVRDWNFSPDIVSAAISSTYVDNALPTAALHYNGLGMQSGVDFENTLRHPRAIKLDNTTSFQYRAAIETIMAAGSWPADRIMSIDPNHDNMCKRCGKKVETDFHVFWECECNAKNRARICF